MPLLKNHNTTDPTLAQGDPAHTVVPPTGHHGHTGPGPVIGAVAGGAIGHHEGHTAIGSALGAAAGHHHAKTHPTAPPHAPGHGDMSAPATGHTHPTTDTAAATEKKLIGKIEHAAGSILCSSTLKAKGIEKQREAEALQIQAAEIRNAERLEAEASAHRERAVAHGAHPHHLNAGPDTHPAGAAPMNNAYAAGVPPTCPAGNAPNAMNVGPTGAANVGHASGSVQNGRALR